MSADLPRARRLLLLDHMRHDTAYGGLGERVVSAPLSGFAAAHWLAGAGYADGSAAGGLADALALSERGARHAGGAAAAAGPKKAVLNGLDREARVVRPLAEVLREASDAWREVCGVVLTREGHEVLYREVVKCEAWSRYLVAVEDLAAAEFPAAGEMSEDERKAAFFNLYNSLVLHAKLVYGHPTSLSKRGTFFNSAAYSVCGVRINTADLEHKVLRRKAADGSELAQFRLAEKDPRMHFVLNCGARSCPPIRPISMVNTEHDIAANTVYFIAKNVDIKGHRARVSRLWKWFRNDFTPGTTRNAALLAWISSQGDEGAKAKILPLLTAMQRDPTLDNDGASESSCTSAEEPAVASGKVKIKFQKYDWQDNGDWDAPKDDSLMPLYDVSFALNK